MKFINYFPKKKIIKVNGKEYLIVINPIPLLKNNKLIIESFTIDLKNKRESESVFYDLVSFLENTERGKKKIMEKLKEKCQNIK